jgi:hypothetical protein
MKLGLPRAAAALALLVTLLAAPITALAQVPSSIGSYVSYGYGTGVHTIDSSSNFTNFQNGAVNNHYPLAQVEQDASPAAAARATFSDSGPLTATAGSQYNQGCSAGNPPPPPSVCQNPNNNVPYANSNYPGGPDSAHVDTCGNQPSCPSARANSDASELAANAWGYYAGGGTQPFSGAKGESHTIVTSDGTLTVTTHSEVNDFVIGDLHVSKVVVETIVTATNGSATANATVVVGKVTVGGVPVDVNDQGVTIQQKSPVPCPPTPNPPGGPLPGPAPGGGSGPGNGGGPLPSTPPLPTHLASYQSTCVPGVDVTYIKVFTAAPKKDVNGTHGTAWATGLHILVTHPTPGPGVPQQSTEYVLGEGYADASTGTGGPGGFGGGFGFGAGDFGFTGPSGDNGGLGSSPAASVAHAFLSNRWWPLVLLFLTLEALVLAAAAAWVWARNAPVEEVVDEVLSP